jgi:hypothetical protein
MKIYNAREQASGLEFRREPGDDGFEDLAVCEAGIVEICVVEALVYRRGCSWNLCRGSCRLRFVRFLKLHVSMIARNGRISIRYLM